ncbi:hypothetical protein QWJ34_20715 [Saccharibacillus sp. CPCC 101409]|uniref:hypothetical protein n=1 Tax=Saccharibacillus sp. CPCC 101409 TaxID=3058041 RepID=UPI00267277D5|nr:hypothetical protein [Saccharibacillus sp. CPCC 101409]MDO3412198.1 hypothetical protein [Saccharibacillus sp. CPCC 101409]
MTFKSFESDHSAEIGAMFTSPDARSEYELRLLRVARELRPARPPAPWRASAADIPAAGAIACGWDEEENFLLISGSGYSLNRPDTGARLLRDRDAVRAMAAFSPDSLAFTPPHGGRPIAVYGFEAGGGCRLTQDGWRAETLYPWWPRASVILENVFEAGYVYLERAALLDTRRLDGPLLCGFSPSGRHLAILGSGGALLYSR